MVVSIELLASGGAAVAVVELLAGNEPSAAPMKLLLEDGAGVGPVVVVVARVSVWLILMGS